MARNSAALLVAIFVASAHADPHGEPVTVPRVTVLDGYRRDQAMGHAWSSRDVVALLRKNPGGYLFIGGFAVGYPIGSGVLAHVRENVDRWQSAIADHNRAHDPDLDAGRICVDWRPDVIQKHFDGAREKRACGSLMGTPQCGRTDCWRDPNDPCRRWEGNMPAVWGPLGRFKTGWLLRVPRRTWDRTVAKYWGGGADWCNDPRHGWGDLTDKETICHEVNDRDAVVLYGKTDAKSRHLGWVSGVGLDLRNPELREWNAKLLVSLLHAQGFDPGEPACVLMGYKPGLWSHYSGRNDGRACPAPDANSWTGFETPDNAAKCWGGAFVPTPYGPGEFEAGMNAQMRTVFKLLDAPAPPALQRRKGALETYARVRFVTTERPDTRGRIWWIWDRDVRASGKLLGEMDYRTTALR